MADKKISALTAASTPLAGTEVLPIVQSGATVKVAVSDLTAGRAISATAITASAGNFVVGTSGNGIDFSATPGTGTSELLADYEEGTWTPAFSRTNTTGFTYTPSGSDLGTYVKIGNQVLVSFQIAGTFSGGSGAYLITGLPYTTLLSYGQMVNLLVNVSSGLYYNITPSRQATTIYVESIALVSGGVHGGATVYQV